MGLIGLEPMTLRLSSACSNQLSYRPGVNGGGKGIRTPDIQLAKLALYQLSYAPDTWLFDPARWLVQRPGFGASGQKVKLFHTNTG